MGLMSLDFRDAVLEYGKIIELQIFAFFYSLCFVSDILRKLRRRRKSQKHESSVGFSGFGMHVLPLPSFPYEKGNINGRFKSNFRGANNWIKLSIGSWKVRNFIKLLKHDARHIHCSILFFFQSLQDLSNTVIDDLNSDNDIDDNVDDSYDKIDEDDIYMLVMMMMAFLTVRQRNFLLKATANVF